VTGAGEGNGRGFRRRRHKKKYALNRGFVGKGKKKAEGETKPAREGGSVSKC